MIRVLAYTLSLVFYYRQVVSHTRQTPPTFSETARLLGYLFLPLHMDSSWDRRPIRVPAPPRSATPSFSHLDPKRPFLPP